MTETKPTDTEDPAAERDDGVDVSLIRWMLSLTPEQRLDILDQNINDLLSLRNAKRED